MFKFAIVAGLSVLMGAASPAFSAEPMTLKDAGVVFNQWIAGFQAHDAEKIMAVFDKSLIYSEQGSADQNYAELKKDYKDLFATKTPPTSWKAFPKEIHAQGGLAVVISVWEQRQKDSAGHAELVARIRSIDIFRPTKAGWKIVRTINYSEPN